MSIMLSMLKQAHNHDNNCYEKHKQRNTIHAMHELNVYVFWRIRISLTNVEVSENLLPYTFFHLGVLRKITKI